jgi:hypothetical protein
VADIIVNPKLRSESQEEQGMCAKESKSKPSGRSIFGAAARSKEFFDHLEAHYRECKRKKVDIDAAVSIIDENGDTYDKGTAKVMDVSPTGAMLSSIKLKKESYPTKPFSIEMRMQSSLYVSCRKRAVSEYVLKKSTWTPRSSSQDSLHLCLSTPPAAGPPGYC